MKSVKLNSGFDLPTVGLGTWKSKPGDVENAVTSALKSGYKHIDCAFAYMNEGEVGNGLQEVIQSGIVKREDVFITSKVWNTFHRADLVRKCLETSLKQLKTNYLDLYLIHWPMAYKEEGEYFPKDENGKFIYSDVDYLETWKAMEALVKEGLIRSIGLSNFNSKQIQRVLDNCEIKPAVVQIEVNLYFPNQKLIDFCHQKGIIVEGYSPLGSPDRPPQFKAPPGPGLMQEPLVTSIATRIGKTPAQVILRWLLQRNVVVLPKSVTPERIKSNLELFDFELSDEDVDRLNNFDTHFRGCGLEWVSDHPHFPFKEEF